ncbi:tocopherol cyclase family protein [Ornithinimicrobium panacihumi]|uniref:tocopherol cyclase family protein n=1 Tax=Ornithinimicrobium panacihumi TaxID=2008449 RepID=UPI003F888639
MDQATPHTPSFSGSAHHLRVDLGPDARVDLTIDPVSPWPHRALGGSSVFQTVPRLNQYWHPWLLTGRVRGTATLGTEAEPWDLSDALVYGEKNWGAEGFPDSWWWGQAHAFEGYEAGPGRGACVAFAGGQVHASPLGLPLRTEVTALVVRLPGGRTVRLGDPVASPVRAEVGEESWVLRGRGYGWEIDVEARSPIGAAHVLPVPLPSEGRNTPGALEHLDGELEVVVRRRGRTVWRARSRMAGLERGGLALAEGELARRGGRPEPKR